MSQNEFENNQPIPEQETAPQNDPFAAFDAPNSQPAETEGQTTVISGPDGPTAVFNAAPETQNPQQPENVLAGIVGAFLFSLIGAAAYFVIYQAGFIAGICGLITIILSAFGYGLFSGRKNTKKGVIFSIIFTIIALLLAEYACLSFEIYQAFSPDYKINFFDAMRALPDFLKESEIMGAAVKDLLIAYALGAVASFSNIAAALKGSAKPRAAKK